MSFPCLVDDCTTLAYTGEPSLPVLSWHAAMSLFPSTSTQFLVLCLCSSPWLISVLALAQLSMSTTVEHGLRKGEKKRHNCHRHEVCSTRQHGKQLRCSLWSCLWWNCFLLPILLSMVVLFLWMVTDYTGEQHLDLQLKLCWSPICWTVHPTIYLLCKRRKVKSFLPAQTHKSALGFSFAWGSGNHLSESISVLFLLCCAS